MRIEINASIISNTRIKIKISNVIEDLNVVNDIHPINTHNCKNY